MAVVSGLRTCCTGIRICFCRFSRFIRFCRISRLTGFVGSVGFTDAALISNSVVAVPLVETTDRVCLPTERVSRYAAFQCNHCAAFLNFVVFGGDFRIVNRNLQEVCIFSVGLELQTICRALRPYAVCAFNDGRQSRDSARTKLPSCKVGDFLSAVFILIELTTSAFVVILYAVCFGRCRSTPFEVLPYEYV